MFTLTMTTLLLVGAGAMLFAAWIAWRKTRNPWLASLPLVILLFPTARGLLWLVIEPTDLATSGRLSVGEVVALSSAGFSAVYFGVVGLLIYAAARHFVRQGQQPAR